MRIGSRPSSRVSCRSMPVSISYCRFCARTACAAASPRVASRAAAISPATGPSRAPAIAVASDITATRPDGVRSSRRWGPLSIAGATGTYSAVVKASANTFSSWQRILVTSSRLQNASRSARIVLPTIVTLLASRTTPNAPGASVTMKWRRGRSTSWSDGYCWEGKPSQGIDGLAPHCTEVGHEAGGPILAIAATTNADERNAFTLIESLVAIGVPFDDGRIGLQVTDQKIEQDLARGVILDQIVVEHRVAGFASLKMLNLRRGCIHGRQFPRNGFYQDHVLVDFRFLPIGQIFLLEVSGRRLRCPRQGIVLAIEGNGSRHAEQV